MNDRLLQRVKTSLQITTTVQDGMFVAFISEVIEYLRDAGVNNSVLVSNSVDGVVVRGVIDLYDYGSGVGSLSPYFIQRAQQLRYSDSEV